MVTDEQLEILLRGAFTKGENDILAESKEFQDALDQFDHTSDGFSQLKKVGADILTGGFRARRRLFISN